MVGVGGATMKCLAKIGVNVLLNYFPVYNEFLVLNSFTQQAVLGLAFFHITKALLNFDLGIISFYSGLIVLPFVKQIPFDSHAYTVSDVELPQFSDCTNIQTARADMNSHEHIDNNKVRKQTFIDCANKTFAPSPSPPPTADSADNVSFSPSPLPPITSSPTSSPPQPTTPSHFPPHIPF